MPRTNVESIAVRFGRPGESDAACLERAMVALSSGFIPAVNWLGTQPGYVFKCSEFGLGYYRDTGSSNATGAGAKSSNLSLEQEQTAWQFAEGCELQLHSAIGLQRELSESEEALLKVCLHYFRRRTARVSGLSASAPVSNIQNRLSTRLWLGMICTDSIVVVATGAA